MVTVIGLNQAAVAILTAGIKAPGIKGLNHIALLHIGVKTAGAHGTGILGVLTGTLLDIDGALNRLGKKVEDRFSKNGDGLVAKGFVTATLLFCVGSMTIVGSLQAGTTGDTTMLITKSMMDLFSSMMLAVTLGIGVLLASGSVLVIEGALVLLASVLSPLLSDTMIAEMTAAGSLMIIGIGLNLAGITKLKVADYLPAILYAPFVSLLFHALGIG